MKQFFFEIFEKNYLEYLDSVINYVLEWMGLNFYDNDGLQPKMTHTKY